MLLAVAVVLVFRAELAAIWRIVLIAAAGVVALGSADRPLRYGLVVAAALVAGLSNTPATVAGGVQIHASRTFFGVLRVLVDSTRQVRGLAHGTTMHGYQSLRPELRLQPMSYYHPKGPLGMLLQPTSGAADQARRVGIVGLGNGGLACYGRPGERWTFFEIDPEVERIARDPRFFTFLRDCPPSVDVELGDGRLTLAQAPNATFDALVIDAFSSDAIPVHLMTREAFTLYVSKLAPGGVLIVHISNIHLDLEPLIGALAEEVGLVSRVRFDRAAEPGAFAEGRLASKVAVLARSEGDLDAVARRSQWRATVLRDDVAAWTDDFSDPLSLLGRKIQ